VLPLDPPRVLELGAPGPDVPEPDVPEVDVPDVGVEDGDVAGFWVPAVEPVSLMDMGSPS
jgi:hypothetical protein